MDATSRTGRPPAGEPAAQAGVGLLLAAGAGRRMGRPKALVTDAAGTPWVRRAADVLSAAGCAPVRVVLGAAAPEARRLLAAGSGEPVDVVVAADWAEGMGASLRAGLGGLDRLAPSAPIAVVLLVDLPDVGVAVVRRLVAAAGREPGLLARAAYAGRPGHPVLLGREHWTAVAAQCAGDRGARDYLTAHDVRAVECGDLATGADRDLPG